MEKEIPVLKILLVGNSGVGKSSIIRRFVEGEFDEHEKPTIPNAVHRLYMAINGCRVTIKIMDAAGMEKYNSVNHSLFRQTNGLIVVYDVTDFKSYHAVKSWLESVRQYCEDSAVLLVGNKCDLLKEGIVNVRDANRIAELEEYEFLETSALENTNIQESFFRLLHLVLLKTNLVQDGEELNIRILSNPKDCDLKLLELVEEQESIIQKYREALRAQATGSPTSDGSFNINGNEQQQQQPTKRYFCC